MAWYGMATITGAKKYDCSIWKVGRCALKFITANIKAFDPLTPDSLHFQQLLPGPNVFKRVLTLNQPNFQY